MAGRSPTVQDIDWFNDLETFGRLDLDPPYQRYSVWASSYKQYFIDTILEGFPSPAIFLHKQTLEDLRHIYNVVDGKQRLTTIFEFQRGSFSLPSNHSQHPGKYFDELPIEAQIAFRNYKIHVEVLDNREEPYLRQVFERLNRNVRKLNQQELRHGRHEGSFIQLMENLADSNKSFWNEVGFRTDSRIRNMKDVEYISEIFLLSLHGVLEGGARTLDDYYALYDDEDTFDEIVKPQRYRYENCLKIMISLGAGFIRSTRFSNMGDFYSLWAALLEFVDSPDIIDYEQTRKELEAFSSRIISPNEIPSGDLVAKMYSDVVRQGVNKKANRLERADIIKRFIVSK